MRWIHVALVLVAAVAARGQMGSMVTGLYNDETSFLPTLSNADLKVVVRVLALGEEERSAVEELHKGYAAALRSEGGAVREFVSGEIEKAQAMQNVELLSAARQRVKEWDERSEQLRKAFLDDLKSLLSREEEARWPVVERELRRLRLVGRGRLAGESVDLVRLTEDVLGSAPEGELGELLGRYSLELDRGLVSRERFLEENRAGFRALVATDAAAAKKVWDEAQQVRGAVRDVNERFAKQVRDLLPVDKRERFERKVFEISYPAIVRPTLAEGYLKDVGELEALDSEQRGRIAAIRARFEADRWAMWMKAGPAWRQFEETDMPQDLAKALGEWREEERRQMYSGAWLPESHPLVRYRRERLELDQRLRRSLDEVLTEAQREAVPGRGSHLARFENWGAWGL